MSRPPCEVDLAIDGDHERFGDAMMLCQDASGSCAHTGRCTFEGECFKPSSIGYRRAKKLLDEMIDAVRHKEGAHVVVWLAHARNNMERYYTMERDGWVDRRVIDPRVSALCAEFGIKIVDGHRYPEVGETRAPETIARILRKYGEAHARIVLSTLAETANNKACLDEAALWAASDMVRAWADAVDTDTSAWLAAWDRLPVGQLQAENIELRGIVPQRFALGGQLHERLYRLLARKQGELFDDRRQS